MSNNNIIPKTRKRKQKGKKLHKISFDEEIVPKYVAEHLSNIELQQNASTTDAVTKKVKRKSEEHKISPESLPTDNIETNQLKKQKRRKKQFMKEKETGTNIEQVDHQVPESNEELELNTPNPTVKQQESIRAKKRKKHQQLLLEKKIKVDLVVQNKSLNYLSQWKHNRGEWKFEKLRQVWLQQNMFDSDRIPDKFWDTLVEYFSNAQGTIRKTIINEALKIIEKCEQNHDEEEQDKNAEDDTNNRSQRAKSIIQCLQE